MSEDITDDLLNVKAVGKSKYQKFREERLESVTPKYTFHDKLTKQELKTFSDMTKKENENESKRARILFSKQTGNSMAK